MAEAFIQSTPRANPRPIESTLALGTVAVATFCCVPAILNLSYLWSGSQFYGHAWAIPFFAVFLIYGERRRVARAMRPLAPPLMGAPVLFFALTFEVLMIMGDVGFAAGIAIPVVLAAVAYALGGTPLLRPLGVPLLFLMTIVPPPRFLTYELLFRLKLLVTSTAVDILHKMGMTVLADGNEIQLPDTTLFVADACSGLTSIITLLPIAGILAYYVSHGTWRRVFIVASVIPFAMLANIARVIGTVLMVSVWGVEAAEGSLHESFGMSTSILGTLAIVGIAKALR